MEISTRVQSFRISKDRTKYMGFTFREIMDESRVEVTTGSQVIPKVDNLKNLR